VSQRKRPGRLWMFFHGRPRRGFPWLIAGVAAAIFVLSLTFAIPGGADVWRTLAPVFLVMLIAGAIAAAVVVLRHPRRR
jgi:hypothetical protein